MSIICRICFAMSLIVCTLLSNASFGQVAPRFEPLHLGEVMPEGWLQTVLERDLKSGYAGHLDELLQDPNSGEFLLRPENNDYVTRAKNRDCRHDDAGLSIPPKPRSWWHAEMIGDWHDSLILRRLPGRRADGEPETVVLLPMGSTLLRRTCFAVLED